MFSHTINCTYGAYEVCRHPERIETEYLSFCRDSCLSANGVSGGRSNLGCALSAAKLRDACKTYAEVRPAPLPRCPIPKGGARLLAHTHAHTHTHHLALTHAPKVDFDAELKDMKRTAQRRPQQGDSAAPLISSLHTSSL